jgi:hypothetical protein
MAGLPRFAQPPDGLFTDVARGIWGLPLKPDIQNLKSPRLDRQQFRLGVQSYDADRSLGNRSFVGTP